MLNYIKILALAAAVSALPKRSTIIQAIASDSHTDLIKEYPLTYDKFPSFMGEYDNVAVLFYSEDCPYNNEAWANFQPVNYRNQREGSDVVFAKVNCKLERKLCDSMNIQRLPTIKLFIRNRNVATASKGKMYNEIKALITPPKTLQLEDEKAFESFNKA